MSPFAAFRTRRLHVLQSLQLTPQSLSHLLKKVVEGDLPENVMAEAYQWVKKTAGCAEPVLVAYPLSFDWSWLYWYFIRFAKEGSPFEYSRCFDIKTALAVKARVPISEAGRSRLNSALVSRRQHTHHAIDDAIEQAEIFANVFEWDGDREPR